MTDAELLVASQHDPAAFRELYDRWAERLLAYFYRRVFDPEVAADLLAETFAVAFERRHRFRDMGRPGSAWLFGIAQKELAHWVRPPPMMFAVLLTIPGMIVRPPAALEHTLQTPIASKVRSGSDRRR